MRCDQGPRAFVLFAGLGGFLVVSGCVGGEGHETAIASTGAALTGYEMIDLGTLGRPGSGAHGINNAGQVVGWAIDSNRKRRAFLWDPQTGMKNLGTLGGWASEATAINDTGQVVGWSYPTYAAIRRAFVWDSVTGMTSLGSPTIWGTSATAINDAGQVVGDYAYEPGSLYTRGTTRAFIWDPENGMRDLGTLGGSESRARGINNAGQVVGYAQTATGETHAFIWDSENGMRGLETLGGRSSGAIAINNAGQIIGGMTTSTGLGHALVWDAAGGVTDLGSSIQPRAISDAGQLAGAHPSRHAFVWDPVTGLTNLDAPAGGVSWATGINDAGQVVGTIRMSTGKYRAFLANKRTSGPRIVFADVEPGQSVEMGEAYTVVAMVENPASAQQVVEVRALETAKNTDTFGLGDTPLEVFEVTTIDAGLISGPHELVHQHQWYWLGNLDQCDELGALISAASLPSWLTCVNQPDLAECVLKKVIKKSFGATATLTNDLVDALVPLFGLIRSNNYSYVVRATADSGEATAPAGSMRVSVAFAKQGLLASYVTIYTLSAVLSGLVSTATKLLPEPLKSQIEDAFSTFTGVSKVIACQNFNAAHDPVPTYQTLATPETVSTDDIAPTIAANHRQLVEAMLTALSHTRALESTMIRLQGAKAAGDAAWVNRHTRLLALYLAAVSTSYTEAATLVEGTLAGLQLSLDEAGARAAAESLRRDGLPPRVSGVLRRLGGSPEAESHVAAANAGILNSLADAVSERSVVHLLLNAAQLNTEILRASNEQLEAAAPQPCGDKVITDREPPKLSCTLEVACPVGSSRDPDDDCDDDVLRVRVTTSDNCDPAPATQTYLICDGRIVPVHAGQLVLAEIEDDEDEPGHCRVRQGRGRLVLHGSSLSLSARAIDTSGNMAECRVAPPPED